jgi:beta-xylosidase
VSYRNPVIPGLHPDPSVCRVGGDYYLVTSTFTYFPAVPIFHSRNLVEWSQIGNVLDRPSQLDLGATRGWASMGVYAPTLRHHDDRFWMITTNVTHAGARSFFVTAEDPSGAWSEPLTVDVSGIDPDLAWDGNGDCWVHFSGLGGIARCRVDDASGALLEAAVPTWSGTGLPFPEAPHLFERDGTWYLLIAEGGTERGHAVSIARGPSPAGPWEGCPANPIVTHRATEQPVQNTGHADLVQATDGSWWMVLLAVRPLGRSPGYHILGRETFLTPVEWADGWPIVAPVALEMPQRAPGPDHDTGSPVRAGRDDFDAPALDPHWLAIRRAPLAVASLDRRPGWLTVIGTDATLDSDEPAFVGRRQQHLRCRVRALVDPGSSTEAGIAVLMDEAYHYEVAVRGEHVVARARIGPVAQVLGDATLPDAPTVLVLETHTDGHAPDEVRLGFEDHAGSFQVLATVDGRFLSTEVVGGFLGRVLGMYAVGGEAAFDWFDYEDLG